jgi:hypothetical protein
MLARDAEGSFLRSMPRPVNRSALMSADGATRRHAVLMQRKLSFRKTERVSGSIVHVPRSSSPSRERLEFAPLRPLRIGDHVLADTARIGHNRPFGFGQIPFSELPDEQHSFRNQV